ncbi:efflux RND transporter periplasmic adaptor subunit [Vibrio natriegens]|uniref:efflux RND transporter periplasmic adaptor subunit n=1 Tax=Vibrio natriegens TaxID=691 RepID=UPI001EFD0545|nr:efflux RND transporter periplasmic adaptor subunit [Vibrio natriegens]MCG9702455.1 efflux RND transporter periplasmic adaptor subunit [Vibrio natriegens]
MKLKYASGLIAIAISSVLISGCDTKNSGSQISQIPSVSTVTLTKTQIHPYHTFIGRTVAENDVDIMPRVGGELMAVHFKDGDIVKKGQILFEIDARPYKAALAYAKASLNKAQAQLVQAQRNAKRVKKLIKDKSISEQQYDDAIADYSTAIASVEEAKATLTSSTLDLEYTSIRAPFSGRVGFSNYRVGDRISKIQLLPLVSITQIDPIRFDFDVDEKLYRRIRNAIDVAHRNDDKLDLGVTLTLSDGTVYPKEGKIYAVGNKIDLDTGSIRAEAQFANSDYSLMPGEYGNLTIKLRNQTIDGLLIPSSAVQQDQAGDYVMVVNDEHVVSRRNIELGQTYGVNQAVLSGLSADEKIIVNGLQKIRPGVTVKDVEQMSEKG